MVATKAGKNTESGPAVAGVAPGHAHFLGVEMGKVHELKIWPSFYEAVSKGTKTFEYRYDDRGYKKGDIVKLREYEPCKLSYTDSQPLLFRIGFTLSIPGNFIILSLLDLHLEEGDPCPDCGTALDFIRQEPCSCLINPPCPSCTEAPLKCPKCGYEEVKNQP